jgi:type IV pilus biogenesis protein CpaD/CtpE
MKRSALIVAGIAVLICSGCASTPSMTTNQFDNNIDTAKVTTINQVARNRGLEVHWVNYPQRKSNTPIVPVSDAPTGT